MTKTTKFLFLFILLTGGIFNFRDLYWAQTVTDHIVISEVQIDSVVGSGGTGDDWVELYNSTSSEINLNGWSVQKHSSGGIDKSFYKKNIENKDDENKYKIPAHGFFLIVSTSASQELQNLANMTIGWSLSAGNSIYLVNDTEKINGCNDANIVDLVGFGESFCAEGTSAVAIEEGQSIERKSGNSQGGNGQDTDNNASDFFIQTAPNPQNSDSPAEPPLSANSNNSDNSNNPDNFGYSNNNSESGAASSGSDEPIVIIYPKGIIINEILPNPDGSDTENEFIELKNTGSEKVDLSGWKLGDDSSRLFEISAKDFKVPEISPGGFLVFYRSETKIALNNASEDGVKFYQPDDQVADSIKYDGEILEGQSYSRANSGKWVWTPAITPGLENNWPPEAVINGPTEAAVGENAVFDASDSSDLNGDSLRYIWNFSDVNRDLEGARVSRIFDKAGQYKIKLTVLDNGGAKNTAEIILNVSVAGSPEEKSSLNISDKTGENPAPEEAEEETEDEETSPSEEENPPSEKDDENGGGKIKVKGLISAEPKILGQQIFYLSGPDIQIYMFKKDFPNLKPGDEVEVEGVKSESGGESRIKLSSKDDIKILSRQSPPQPKKISAGEVNEDTEGCLVEITGEITEIKSNTIYLDDGSDEVKVYIKDSTGIGKPGFSEGDTVRMAGIVSQTTSGYRLLPRYPEDIEIIQKDSGQNAEEAKKSENGFAAASSADGDSGNIYLSPDKINDNQIIKYLSATAAALFIVLIGFFVKIKYLPKLNKKDRAPEKEFTVTIEE